jgi:hypothetical protein
MLFERFFKVLAGILNPSIRMDNQTGRWIPATYGSMKRSEHGLATDTLYKVNGAEGQNLMRLGATRGFSDQIFKKSKLL